MARPRPPPVSDARRREALAAMRAMRSEGAPMLVGVARAWDAGQPLAPLFADDLAAAGARELAEPPGRPWRPLAPEQAVTLLALRRYRSLAYNWPRGDPAQHRLAAQRLADALGVARAWCNTDVTRVVDPVTLTLPPGCTYGWTGGLTKHTFEEVVLLEGDGFAALALWADED